MTFYSRGKLLLTALTLLVFTLFMIGCGDSSSSSSSNNGGNTPTPGGSNPGNSGGSGSGSGGSGGGSGQSAATFVYVANNGTRQVQAFSVNGGTLTQVQGSPFANGSFTPSMGIAGNTLAASTEAGLKTWTIDSNSGGLTAASTSSAGGFLIGYANNFYGSSSTGITAYSAGNGKLTQIGNPVSVADLCADCTGRPLQVSNDGKYLYVILSGFHDVNGFAVLDRASDGAISNPRLVSAVNGSTSQSAAVVVSSDNKHIYEFTQSGTIALWQFDPASAKATMVNFSAAKPSGIVSDAKISPDGKYLAGISAGVNRIDVYSIDSGSGALTPVPGSPFATGVNPTSLAFSSNSQSVFVDCRGDGSADLFVYTVGSNGALTESAHQTLGGNPGPLAVK